MEQNIIGRKYFGTNILWKKIHWNKKIWNKSILEQMCHGIKG
jgi:hypothetical protein